MKEGDHELFVRSASSGLTAKEYVFKYLSYLPLFILSLAICLGAAFLYERYAVPQYKATTLILVAGSVNRPSNLNTGDLIESALTSQPRVNLDNEILRISANSLMERVVAKNGFNTSYYIIGKFRNTDLYLDAPFRLVPQFIGDSSKPLTMTLSDFTQGGGIIKYASENKIKSFHFKWNQPFWAEAKRFVLVNKEAINGDAKYVITWNPVKHTANELSASFLGEVLDRKTSTIQLSVLIENLKRGQDILDALVKEYQLADIEERSSISQNTIQFIDDRLNLITKELSGIEGGMENYQGNNQITDVERQSSMSFNNSDNVSRNLSDLHIQQGVVQMILGYFNTPALNNKLVPSTLGLNDATLASLIAHYNDLQLKRQRETPLAASNSILIKDLDNQINDVKGSILEALHNITKNLQLQENNLQEQNSQYRQFLSSLPRKERVIQEYKRKQGITEDLYIYLMKKREETAIINTSSKLSNYHQIDPATGYGPVEPKTRYIRLFAVILGLLIPVGWINIRDLLNDKVRNRNDITNRMQIPVLGELSHIPKRKNRGMLVMESDLLGEQFRIIRTHLSTLQDKQVILVTSSTNSEGKSFVSLNLAAVLAIPGKKVALLEFDMRNPCIFKTLNINHSKGLANYLTSKVQDLSEISKQLDNIPSLHVYPAGPLPYNPADLLLSGNLPHLMEKLKKEYDYIIIDTAPVGLVTDAFILGEYSDAVVYIVRQRHTLKKQLDFINDIFENEKFVNMGLVINDVKTGAKYGYGYGYGYNYSYDSGKAKKGNLWRRMLEFYN